MVTWCSKVSGIKPVVGELTFDEPGRDPHIACRVAELEDSLVLADGDLDVAGAERGGETCDLLAERLDRHDRLDLVLE